ncbi:MAG: undecaprenyl-phosphate glucose phosphotransferase [Bacillota bacterium]
MQIQHRRFYITRITADLLIIVVSFIIACFFSMYSQDPGLRAIDYFFLLMLILVWLFSSKVTFLYDEFRSRNYSFELITVIKNVLIQSLSAIVFIFLVKEVPFHRGFVVRYSAMLLLFLSMEKYLFRRVLDNFRKKGKNLRNIIIIGAGTVGQKFYELIKINPQFGYRMLGFLDDDKKYNLNGLYLGKLELLEDVLEEIDVDDVIIALPNHAGEKIQEVIDICDNYTTRVRIIPDYFRFLSNRYNVSMFDRFPVISVREERLNELHWSLIKRGFDLTVTMLLFLFVFSWLWPVIMIAIMIDSRGHIFFKQERCGKDNRTFVTYKFRSLQEDSREFDPKGQFLQVSKADPRVTRVGRILRKTNLDELPQFLNVLIGDMSIVGPRPHPVPLNFESREYIRQYMHRYLVKPGLTGWAQVNGLRGETKDPCMMQKRVEHDLWYIDNWSFWLDLQIVFLTVVKMFKGDPNAY